MNRGRPKKLTDELKSLIVNIKKDTPNLTAKNIRGEIRLHLITSKNKREPNLSEKEIARIVDSEELPGESVINKYLAKINPQLKIQLPLDTPWSIGDCIKYNIPADMIPVLIEIQKLGLKADEIRFAQITNRQAKWFAMLYPSVQRLIKNKYHEIHFAFNTFLTFLFPLFRQWEEKEQVSQRVLELEELTLLILVGFQYANREQASEITRESHLDTSGLDNLYFVQEDISVETIIDAWWNVFGTEYEKKQRTEMAANFRGFSAKQLEKIFGTLTLQQVDSVSDFSHALNSGFVSARKWREQHPKEYAEIYRLWKEKGNERLNYRTRQLTST